MKGEHVTDQLDAYVDRELDVEAARAVRGHVRECLACQRRVAEREALSQFVRGAPLYAAPARLRARVSLQLVGLRFARRLALWATAAAALISLGVGINLLRSTATPDHVSVSDVVDSHVRSLLADHLFDVQATDQQKVKPWFLGRLDFAPLVLDLAPNGFPLVGGRLDYLHGRPVAALVYQRHEHTINLFTCPDDGNAPAAATSGTVRGFHVRQWWHDGMSFWAVSDLNDLELSEFVSAMQAS